MRISVDLKTRVRDICLFILVMGCIVAAVVSGGCFSPDEGDDSQSEVSRTIGAEGGIVEITDPGSALYGAKVYIPPGALRQDREVAITSCALPGNLPDGYKTAGCCLSFLPDNITFDVPIRLYLPYADTNDDGIVDGQAVTETDVRALYYNETTGQWEEMDLYDTETLENRAVIESEHFSTYLAYIDPADAQPYDTGTAPVQAGGDAAAYEPGDCYHDDSFDAQCCYYYLTVTRRGTDLLAVMDRNATYTTNGYPAVISPAFDSATFDAASAFERVLASGDASLWEWEAEFVREHTYLLDYRVEDDPATTTTTATTDTGTENIYCQIEAEGAAMVRITWQINLDEQIVYPSTPQGSGHMLVIRFRAAYR